MLQKSYYHVWNPYEILHWMSYKNKNLKKIVRTHFRTKLISKNLPVSFAVFLIKTQIHILIINKNERKIWHNYYNFRKRNREIFAVRTLFSHFFKKNRENAPVRRILTIFIFIMQAKCGIKNVFQIYRFLTYDVKKTHQLPNGWLKSQLLKVSYFASDSITPRQHNQNLESHEQCPQFSRGFFLLILFL